MSRVQSRSSRATTGIRAACRRCTAGRSTTGTRRSPTRTQCGADSCLASSAVGAACTGGACFSDPQAIAQQAAAGSAQHAWHTAAPAPFPHDTAPRTGPKASPTSRKIRSVRRETIGGYPFGYFAGGVNDTNCAILSMICAAFSSTAGKAKRPGLSTGAFASLFPKRGA